MSVRWGDHISYTDSCHRYSERSYDVIWYHSSLTILVWICIPPRKRIYRFSLDSLVFPGHESYKKACQHNTNGAKNSGMRSMAGKDVTAALSTNTPLTKPAQANAANFTCADLSRRNIAARRHARIAFKLWLKRVTKDAKFIYIPERWDDICTRRPVSR